MINNYLADIKDRLDIDTLRLNSDIARGLAKLHGSLLGFRVDLILSEEILAHTVEEFRKKMEREKELREAQHRNEIQRLDDEMTARELRLDAMRAEIETIRAKTETIKAETEAIRAETRRRKY